MIIPNEKVYVEEILLSKKKPNNLSIKGLIRYIAKYFYNYCIKERNMNLIEYTGYVLSVMTHFKLSKLEYQEYKYARYTKTYCKNMMAGIFSPTFREVETISFTEDELATINSAVYRKERKVLFTLYALAKIYSPQTGWVNNSEADIFKEANVSVSNKERIQILHSLYRAELIEINHMIDKSGYCVELNPDSPVVFETSILHDFGNQYLCLMDKNLRICPSCGKPYRHSGEYECCGKCRQNVGVVSKEKK